MQTKRTWPRVYEVNYLLNAIYFQDRQDRAEDFLLHRGRVRRHVHQDGRLDETIASIMAAAVEDRSAFEKPDEPIEMTIADDAAVIWALLRILAIELMHGFLETLQKFRGNVLEYEHVVRCGARLTAIEPTPKSDATGRNPQISGRVDDGGILSAEFEHNRGQVLCRSGHDDPGDSRAARKKDVIPRLCKQRGGLRDCAENDRKRFAVQVLRNEPRDHFGGRSGHFRGLDNSSVAGGNRRD